MNTVYSRQPLKKLSHAIAILFCVLWAPALHAATIESTATGGSWTSTSTWVGGVVPGSTDDVVIATTTGNSVTLSAGTTCNSLTVNLGATLTASTFLLTLTGDFIIVGTFSSTSGGLRLQGTTDQLISGFTTTGTVTMAKTGGTATFVGNVNAAALTINGAGGTLNLGVNRTHTFTGVVTLTSGSLLGGSSTVNLSFAGTVWTGTGSLFTANTSTVVLTGAAQTINTTTTFNNLTYSGSNGKTIAASVTVTVNGLFTIANGTQTNIYTGTLAYGPNAGLVYNIGTANRTTTNSEWPSPFVGTAGVTVNGTAPGVITLNAAKQMGNNTNVPLRLNPGATLSTANLALTLHGDFINSATLTAGSSVITIGGTVATQNIGGFVTTGAINMTKTAGTATATGAFSAGSLLIDGVGGTLNLGNFTHAFGTGAITLNNGTLDASSATLAISGNITGGSATFITTNMNLTLTANVATQSIIGFTSTGTLTSSRSGGTATVQGNLNIGNLISNTTGGTLNLGTNLTHTITGSITQTLGTINLGTNTTINLTGTGTVISGTITAGTSTVVLAGAAQTIATANTFNNLTYAGTGAKAASGALTINGLFTIANGSNTNTFSSTITYGSTAGLRYDAGSSNRTVSTEWPALFAAAGVSMGVNIAGTGIITLNEGKTLGTGSGSNGANVPLTIESGATLNTNNFAITFQANFTNNGTFNAGSSAISFTRNLTQTITGPISTAGLFTVNKTVSTDVNINGAVSAAGFTHSNGTINMGNGLTHTFSGTWTRTAGILNLNNSTLVFTATGTMFSGTGSTFNAGTGTVVFSGNGNTTCPVLTYNNLTLSNSGIKTFATTPTVNGILSLEGTATVVVTSGVVTYGGDATLRYNKPSPYTTTIEEFPNSFPSLGGVIIAGTGTITLDAAKDIAYKLTINTGASVNLGTGLTHISRGLVLGGAAPQTGNFGGTGSGAITIDPVFFAAATGQLNSVPFAATWTGAVSTDWENNGNWAEGSKPNSFTDAIIPVTVNQPVLTAAAVSKNLEIAAGATVNTAGFQYTLNGHLFNSGTLTLSGSNILIDGILNQLINGFSTTGSVTSTKTGGIARFTSAVSAASLIVNGAGSTLNLGNGFHTISGNVTVTAGTLRGGSASLDVSGNISAAGTFTGDTLNITYAGTAAQSSIGYTTLGSVSMTKTAETVTLTGNVNAISLTINGTGGTLNLGTSRTHTISGNVTLTNGTLNGGSSTLNLTGNWTGSGSNFTAGTSLVVLTGVTQTISISTTFNSLTFGGTGAKTIAASVAVTINGTMTIANAAIANNFTGTITYGPSAGIAYNPSSSRTVGAEWPATFNGTGGIIFFANTTTLNENKILGPGVNINLSGGNLSASSANLTLEGNITGAQNFVSTSGIITFTGSANQTVKGFSQTSSSLPTTGSVVVNKSGGTLNFTTDLAVGTGGFSATLSGGASITFNSSLAISFGGNYTVSGGTVNFNNCNVTLFGTFATQNLDGFTTTGNLIITKASGTATLGASGSQAFSAASLTVNGAAGILVVNTSATLTLTGTTTLTAGTLRILGTLNTSAVTPFNGTGATISIGSASTFNYSGSAQTVRDLTYFNLILSGSGVKTTSSSVVVNGRLTLEGTASLSAAITYGGEASLRYNYTTPITTTDFEFPSLFQFSGGVIIGGTATVTLNGEKTITAPLVIETGAKLNLSTFTGSSSKGLTLGGVTQAVGTYGGNTSAAGTINATFFADATGILTVTAPDATWLGLTSDWSAPTNWSIGVVPDVSTSAIINSGTPFQPVLTAASNCAALTVGAGASLTTNGFQLGIYGSFTNTGTVTWSSSNIIIGGGLTQSIAAITTTGNVTVVKNSNTATLAGVMSANSLTINGSGGTLNLGAGLTHTFTGNITITAGTLAGGSSNLTFTGSSDVSIGGFTTTGNFTFTKPSGTATFTGNISVNTITLNGAAFTLNLGTGITHTMTGNMTITAGTLQGGSSNLVIAGTNTHTIAGFSTTGNITMTKPSGTATISGNMSFNTLTLNGTSGILALGSGTHTLTGDIIITAGTLAATTASLVFQGSANQTLPGFSTSVTTGNITSLKTGGTLSLTGNLTIASLILNGPGSTIDLGSSVRSHSIGGNLTVTAGTLNANAASITLSGSVANQSIAGFTTTGNISMTKTAGTATFTGNVSAANLVLNGAGGTLNLGNGLTHTFSGTWTRTNGNLEGGSSILNFTASGNFITGVTGSFLPGTGTVVYGANAAQTIGPFTYNNLVISGSGIKTVTTATVNGVFVMDGTATLSAPITYGASATLQYTRSTAFTTTANEFPNTFTPSGGVVISGTGTITLDAAKAISGTLTINTSSTLDLNGLTTHTCFGLTLGGTMQTVLGTYGRTGSGAANISDVFFAGTSGRITLNSITTNWLGFNFDWSDPTNWTNGVPTSVSDAVVSTGVPQQPLISSAAETRNLTINAGATVTSVGIQLTVFGNLVKTGSLALGSAPVIISGTGTQTIDGFSTTGNLLVTKLGGVATVNGDITVHDITVNGAGGTLNLGAGLSHTVSGNLTLTAGAIDGGSSNVTFTGALTQTSSGFTTTGNITSNKSAGSLTFSTGFGCTDFTQTGAGTTVNLGAGLSHTINGNLTINSGTFDAGSANLSLGGNLSGSGTFDADACNLILIGTANQSIPGFTSTGNLSMQKTGGTATLGGALTAVALTVNGAGGTLNMGTSLTHTFSGDVTLTQGTLQASNTTIRISSNTATAWTGDGSVFNAGTGTVVFNGNNQTINTSTTFNNLTLSGAGSKTFTSGTTTTVNGLMTISNGSSVNTFTGATISYGGTAALRYNAGASSRTVSAEWPASFSSTGGITVDGAEGGVITLNGGKVIGNNNNTHLTINSGATLATNNFAVTLHGNLVQSGTLTAGSSNFTLAGTNATQSIDGFSTTGTVALTKTAGTATLNGNVNAGALTINGTGGTLNLGTGRTHTISGNVTLSDGTLLGGNNTLNVNGSGASAWSGTSSVFSRGTSSVVFGGNAANLSVSTSFHNLSFNGTGTAVAPATLAVSGNMVTNQSVNFTTAGNTLTFDGTSLQTVSGTSNPAFVNVTVNSSGNVQLATSASASGNLVLQSGDLRLSTQQLTVSGSITRTTGKLGAASGTLVLNGSSSQSLPASIFVGDSVRNLTMNNSAGVVLNSATRLTGNFTPTAGVFTTNNHLTLGSTAAGTARVLAGSASGGYITGTVAVERYVPSSRRNWRFLSSQVASATLLDWQNEMHITGPGGAANGFDATTLNKGSVFTYDETDLATSNSGDKNIGWVSATNITNSLVVGKGYRVFVRGDRNPGRLTGNVVDQGEITLNLNGTLNQGSISLPVTCTFSGPGSTFSAANDGWNLVANPYACDYDWDHFWTNNNSNPTFFQNLESDVWVFDPVANNYVTYNAVSNTGTGQLVSGIIPSGSSFWVKANNASPVLQLVEASKTASNPGSLFKNDRPDKAFRIVLNDMNSMDADEAAILYHEKALRASDKMDVTKMSGSANIAALTDDGKLTTINSRPAIVHGDTIPLAIRTEKGRYTISFRNVENLHTTLDAVLIDNTTGSVIDVRSTPAYEFDVVETSTDIYDRNRFKILIGAKGQLPEPGNYGISLENAISVFPNPAHDDVFIRQLGGLEIQSAVVFDINGKTQLTIPYINSTKFQVDTREWKPGVYFVETTDVKGNVLKQKLIKQ